MKILVLEYITGGGLRQEALPAGLVAEAELMTQALLDDLLKADPAIELLLLRDDRLPAPTNKHNVKVIFIGCNDDFQQFWRDCAAHCDAVWPIAPETDGILTAICRGVEASTGFLLNSSADAVSIASSKLQTIALLTRQGIATVTAQRLSEADLSVRQPVVVKPDDGVGCEGMRIFSETAPDPAAFPSNFIVQPWITGESLSLSGIFCHGAARLLSVNRQIIDMEQQSLQLRACEVNVYHDARGDWQDLLQRIARALPGLWGYVGIDLILTQAGPLLLEINPRLTSSYAGIRRATGINPAEQVLGVMRTQKIDAFASCKNKIYRVEWSNSHGVLR